jgi:hypothetical protein
MRLRQSLIMRESDTRINGELDITMYNILLGVVPSFATHPKLLLEK